MKIVCEQRVDEGVRYFKDEVCGTIRTIDGGGDKRVIENNELLETECAEPEFRVRKLTQKECWRLMGFDDQDFELARAAMNETIYNGRDRSGSQLYKQAGNSIVVDVLLHIMENLYEAMPYLFEDMEIGSFFSGIGAFEKALSKLGEERIECATDGCENPKLHQLGYVNGHNGVANRVYEDNLARTLAAEAGGGGAKTGWYRVPEILDVKQMGREGHPRRYNKGVAPAITARDYKDPLRVVVHDETEAEN